MSYRNQPTQEECDDTQRKLIEKAPWKEFIDCWSECCFHKICWHMKKERGMSNEDIIGIDDTFCPMVGIMEREFDAYFRDKSLD